MPSVDVVVVGAGPSGCSVAKFASEKGLEVLVLEKKREAGVPSPCAGYVSKLVSRYFNVDKRCRQQDIENMLTVFPSGRSQVVRAEGWIVERMLFDRFLAMQAARAGARFSMHSKVVGIGRDGAGKNGADSDAGREAREVVYRKDGESIRIKARVIVGADGVLSGVARLAGIQTNGQIAVCPQYEMVGVKLDDPTTVETYFDVDYAPGSYAWVYPTGRDSAKVGLGIAKPLAGQKPGTFLNKFISRHPVARKRFVDATPISSIVGMLPINGLLEKICVGNVLLVGDAAGMADPISGAGICTGIIAGKIAAEEIYKGLENSDYEGYERRVRKLLGPRLERSLKKREIADGSYRSNETLEEVLPRTWITFKGFWRD